MQLNVKNKNAGFAALQGMKSGRQEAYLLPEYQRDIIRICHPEHSYRHWEMITSADQLEEKTYKIIA